MFNDQVMNVMIWRDHDDSEGDCGRLSYKLTKLDERERSQSAVDPLFVICNNELPLKFIQEAEGQDIGIVFCANHQVPHSKRACETIESSTMYYIKWSFYQHNTDWLWFLAPIATEFKSEEFRP